MLYHSDRETASLSCLLRALCNAAVGLKFPRLEDKAQSRDDLQDPLAR
jgi:hypothetical protein